MSNSLEEYLEAGRNCWRVENAAYASMVVDPANYYRDLYESICKAKHSIFIVGWDMDSRIHLIRGEAAENAECPVTLFELIEFKAKQNPDMQIYLNKWSHSVMFASSREILPALHWRTTQCPNIHFRFDTAWAIHGSHHQKIVVIDDEVAYTGGIDIAVVRWDDRDHKPFNPCRIDPGDMTKRIPDKYFGPNHDIQIVVAGGAAQALAELARKRWIMAADYDAIPIRPYQADGIPNTWPDSDPPDFEDIKVGVSLTFTESGNQRAVRQIEKLYIDNINAAEKFLYIENQYLAHDGIARAINRRLQEKPELRVLIFSSRDAAGLIEEASMWTKRIRFKRLVTQGNVRDRVAMTYKITTDGTQTEAVHVHAKVMIVDDKFLQVGSSNINNRSMVLDSECDLLLDGRYNDAHRAKIADIRNDLIREHSGLEKDHVQRLVDEGAPISAFLEDVPHSTQHLRPINDSLSTGARLAKRILGIGNASEEKVPPVLKMISPDNDRIGFPYKRTISLVGLILVLAWVLMSWREMPISEEFSADAIRNHIESFRDSQMAIPVILGIFVLGGLLFIPVTIMIAATATAFGPVYAFCLALGGALLSASVTFLIGFLAGEKLFKNVTNTAYQKVSRRIEGAGVAGVATVRMLPLAPYTLVNMIFGVSPVRYVPYIIGTTLGMVPGTFAMVVLGDSLGEVWRNRDTQSMLYLAFGVFIWIAVVAGIHYLVRRRDRISNKAKV